MEADGRLVKVEHSEFASPIVPVIKNDGSLRICGDYKATLNPQLDSKVYPLPVVEDCFVAMRGGKLFTKIDIKQAYNHIKLRKCDELLTTINTHQQGTTRPPPKGGPGPPLYFLGPPLAKPRGGLGPPLKFQLKNFE